MQIMRIHKNVAMPVLAVALALPAPFACAEVGDLDPSFADHGRQVAIPGAQGTARSVELPDTGGVFIGGGWISLKRGFDYCTATAASFATRLNEDGGGDPAFEPAAMTGIEAMDLARQADGRIVGVGRTVLGYYNGGRCGIFADRLAAFRLSADGALDLGFGIDGIFRWEGRLSGKHRARSLSLDPDGRIVVAGTGVIATDDTSESRLLVLRLLADGGLDPTFGDGGVFVGPIADLDADVRIARTQAGSYRVTSTGDGNCAVVGIAAAGVPDGVFGQASVARVEPAGGGPVACTALDSRADGRLLVAGSAGEHGFVVRLLDSGAPDPTFTPPAPAALTPTTAISSAVDRIYVAGSGPSGASISRLDATGALDTSFGDSGHTWIDLPSTGASMPIVRDLALGEDGSVVAAGSDAQVGPFVVRLLGVAGGLSRGVIGFSSTNAAPQEDDGQAIIRVRRSGGKDGAVSVGYRTVADAEATADEDFTSTEGTLAWTDGDRSEREIAVSIGRDEGSPEGTETFHIALDDVRGGAGFGKQVATVSIQPDGAPGGQIQQIDVYNYGPGIAIADEINPAQVWLGRRYYSLGRVCVTVTTQSGTAVQGEDFTAINETQCWDDQDNERKVVQIPTIEDGLAEGDETFTVELSNPTGGAILGKQRVATVTILANAASDPPPPPPDDHGSAGGGSDGGGGPAGVVELLMLLGLLFFRSSPARTSA